MLNFIVLKVIHTLEKKIKHYRIYHLNRRKPCNFLEFEFLSQRISKFSLSRLYSFALFNHHLHIFFYLFLYLFLYLFHLNCISLIDFYKLFISDCTIRNFFFYWSKIVEYWQSHMVQLKTCKY